MAIPCWTADLSASPISPYLLTGFLGSGKTTLLRQLLTSPELHDTAVIVNELGEIGLDHELISFSADSTVVLPGGCVCCTVREDIEKALRELLDARDAKRIPPFSRVVIETTGIADPVPLLMTLHQNPLARSRLSRPIIITVVDGVLGPKTLDEYREAQVQVVNADLVLISKSDLIDSATVGLLRERIFALNPWTQVHAVNLLRDPLDYVLSTRESPGGVSDAAVARVLGRYTEHRAEGAHGGIRSHCLIFDRPLDWTGFGVWMTLLLHRYGDQVLRVKGILDVDGLSGPTIFQSARHLVHPPLHLDNWPSDDRRSRLVFIMRGIDPVVVEASLRAFDRGARNAVEHSSDHRRTGGGGAIAGRPVRRPSAPSWIKG
jgi:G3E family GTPase